MQYYIDKDTSPQKSEFHEKKKVILCVRWDHRDIINLEFLRHNETLNVHLYIQQLQRVHILSHPPYSTDIRPTDYYHFRSLQNALMGKTFCNENQSMSSL